MYRTLALQSYICPKQRSARPRPWRVVTTCWLAPPPCANRATENLQRRAQILESRVRSKSPSPFNAGRPVIAAKAVGMARAALDESIRFARQHDLLARDRVRLTGVGARTRRHGAGMRCCAAAFAESGACAW